MSSTAAKRPLEGDQDENLPPAKRRSVNFQDLVTIIVGPEKIAFNAPKDILCRHSRFFRTALNAEGGAWLEHSTKIITLPDDKGCIFTIFLEWAFTKEIVLGLPDTSTAAPFHRLIELYVVADKLDCSRLKDQTMGELFKLNKTTKFVPKTSTLHFGYNNCHSTSKLHEWILDILIHKRTAALTRREDLLDCPELYAEALRRARRHIQQQKPSKVLREFDYKEEEAASGECT